MGLGNHMAGHAVDLLLDEINAASKTLRTVLFDTEPIVRPSSGPAPG